MTQTTAFKVLTTPQWAEFERDRCFCGSTDDIADGYIHLSTAPQLEETIARHFAGQTGLYIVEIDLAKLGDALRWEPARGGTLFPHYYGNLPIDAVVAIAKRD